MIFKETRLKDCFIIEPNIFNDDRGYFFESFNQKIFNEGVGKAVDFVQDNESLSVHGVIRGLHFQTGKHAQAKLVRVIKGSILDIALDLRKKSSTFGQYVAMELNEENKTQLFVPRGFAHGFAVLSDTAIFSYKSDNFYNKDSEAGIRYNDKFLDIDWKIPEDQIQLSEKDRVLPTFEEYFE